MWKAQIVCFFYIIENGCSSSCCCVLQQGSSVMTSLFSDRCSDLSPGWAGQGARQECSGRPRWQLRHRLCCYGCKIFLKATFFFLIWASAHTLDSDVLVVQHMTVNSTSKWFSYCHLPLEVSKWLMIQINSVLGKVYSFPVCYWLYFLYLPGSILFHKKNTSVWFVAELKW